MDTLREKVRQQLASEDEARALGSDRHRTRRPPPWRTVTAGVSEESELPPGRQLLELTIMPTAAAIAEFCGGRLAGETGGGSLGGGGPRLHDRCSAPRRCPRRTSEARIGESERFRG
jgi:hypothetical protein